MLCNIAHFPQLCQHELLSIFVIWVHLKRKKWYVIVFICISLITSEIEHIFIFPITKVGNYKISISSKHCGNLILKTPFAVARKTEKKTLEVNYKTLLRYVIKECLHTWRRDTVLLSKKAQFCSDARFSYVELYNWWNFNKYAKFLELNMILKCIQKKRWLRITEKIF